MYRPAVSCTVDLMSTLRFHRPLVVSATLAALGICVASDAAQDAPQPTTTGAVAVSDATSPSEIDVDRSPFRIDLTAWIWLTGLNGTVGARGSESDVSATFFDILDDSSSLFGLAGRVEIGYERLGAFVDAVYTDVKADDQTGRRGLASVDLELEQFILDFGVMYRVVDRPPIANAAKNPNRLSVDLYAGGRYTDIELTLDPAMLPSRSQSRSWIDPIFGAKVVAPLTDRIHVAANGDIGGFGVSSEFTWSSTVVFGYDFRLGDAGATIYAGYRAIGWDYSSGSGDDEFIFDLIQHGPIIGFAIRF